MRCQSKVKFAFIAIRVAVFPVQVCKIVNVCRRAMPMTLQTMPRYGHTRFPEFRCAYQTASIDRGVRYVVGLWVFLGYPLLVFDT